MDILLYTRYYLSELPIWDFVCIHNKSLSNQVPHKLLVSNLQRNLAHILYRDSMTLHLTLVTPLRFHLTFAASLCHSPPNPCSTIRNIHIIFVSSLGRSFDTSFWHPLIVNSPWVISSHNRSFQDLWLISATYLPFLLKALLESSGILLVF